MSINTLKDACVKLGEKKEEFYAVNMHGYELSGTFKVPKGIRVIMYCYTGEVLYVCDKLDQFIWNVFLDEDATYNYCTFISALALNPKMREHFCVYEEGDKINEIIFKTDEPDETGSQFQDGIYKLPVKAAVYDGEDTIYVSSEDIFPKAIKQNVDIKKVVLDQEATASLISYKGMQTVFFSPWKVPLRTTSLYKLIREFTALERECTILLMTCREGKGTGTRGRTVYSEVKRMIGSTHSPGRVLFTLED